MSSTGDPFKCLMGSAHVHVVSRFIIAYQLFFGLICSIIALPYFLWMGVLSLIVCLSAALALHRRKSALLLPLFAHLHFTLLLLLFLGGFVFFANIFFNKGSTPGMLSEYDTEDVFFMDTEKYAILLHLLNVFLLLFHMWHISVISSCKKFFDSGSELITINVECPSTRAQS